MARNPKSDANLKPIKKGELSKEEAKKRGSAGGKKSVEVRREKRDARAAARYILERTAKGMALQNLKELGGSEADGLTNMEVLQARLYAAAMGGNLQAMEMLLKLAGYWAEENRAERESIASERRKELELEARMKALGSNPEGASMAVNMGSEEGGSDVVIYIPKMMTEKECEVPPEDQPTQEGVQEKPSEP